jgi:hypothetical protein
MKKIRRSLGALALFALGAVGFVGCGAESGGPSAEDTASTEEAIGWSCLSATPSVTVSGGFSPRLVSATTYSDCFKAEVVQVNDYDFKYDVGGYTRISWGDALPSSADCTGSVIYAYLARLNFDTGEWDRVNYKSSYGDLLTDNVPGDIELPPKQPAPPLTGPVIPFPKDPRIFGPISQCRPPEVYFWGSDMPSGYRYRIITSARLPGAVLRKVAVESFPGTCGQKAGDTCCTSGDSCSINLDCNPSTNKCEPCGTIGLSCCQPKPVMGTPNKCSQTGAACDNGVCADCGSPGGPCCMSPSNPKVFDLCDLEGSCGADGRCGVVPPVVDCGSGVGKVCCTQGAMCGTGLDCALPNGVRPKQSDAAKGKCIKIFGASCHDVGQSCTAQTDCCAPYGCDLVSKTCKPNPNETATHFAANCDQAGDLCCADLQQGPLGGCDPVFVKNLSCQADGHCGVPAAK